MLRTIALAIALVLGCVLPVQAQNRTCPTAPPGDSTNKCASTAFVQGAVVALPLTTGDIFYGVGGVATPTAPTSFFDSAFCAVAGGFLVRTGSVWQCSTTAGSAPIVNGGPFTINPSGNSGLVILQPSASGIAVNPTLNSISIADTINAGSGTIDGLSIFHGFGGNLGNRQAIQVQASLNSATGNAAGNYVAGDFIAVATVSDGGGTGTEKGALFGLNSICWLQAAAIHMAECSGVEVNMLWQSGSSGLDKYGVKVVQETADVVAGSRNDAAFFAGNQSGAGGWGTLFQIGDGLNQSPLKTTGSVMSVKGSPTFAHGIDLSGGTCSTDCFKSSGFSVSGAGAIAATTLNVTDGNTIGVQLLSGNSGQFASIGVGRTAAELQESVAAANGQFFSTSLAGDGVVAASNNLLLGTTVAGKQTQLISGAGLIGLTVDLNQNVVINAGMVRSTFGTPTIASGACGTGANGTIGGSNQSGLVTIGAVATTTCTISFSATLATAPNACVIFPANTAAADQNTTRANVSSIGTASWVISGSALANTNYRYFCL